MNNHPKELAAQNSITIVVFRKCWHIWSHVLLVSCWLESACSYCYLYAPTVMEWSHRTRTHKLCAAWVVIVFSKHELIVQLLKVPTMIVHAKAIAFEANTFVVVVAYQDAILLSIAWCVKLISYLSIRRFPYKLKFINGTMSKIIDVFEMSIDRSIWCGMTWMLLWQMEYFYIYIAYIWLCTQRSESYSWHTLVLSYEIYPCTTL